MIIGLDFDEVISHFLEPLIKRYNKKNGSSFNKDDFESFELWNTWNISKEDAIKVIEEFHEKEEIESIEPIEKAVESITSLLDNGDKLIVITARHIKHEKQTKDWINYHLKTKLEVIYSGDYHKEQEDTKANICKRLKVEIMLEDSGKNALECAEAGIKVLLFDKPWNQNIEHENITRVNGWNEAIKLLQH